MADGTNETRDASTPNCQHSRTPRKSGRLTPLQRMRSATACRTFSVIKILKLPCLDGPESLSDHYRDKPDDFKDAITLALEEYESGLTDPQVMKISCQDETIQVELLYRSDQSLLSVQKKRPEKTKKIKEELTKIGVKGKITVTIKNQEELDKKVKEIR